MISLAYYQSSLVVEHLIDTYGEPKFHEFIRSYGRGLETKQAMKEVFGASVDADPDGVRRAPREAVQRGCAGR